MFGGKFLFNEKGKEMRKEGTWEKQVILYLKKIFFYYIV